MCESVLAKWILPRWENTPIDQIRTVAVEEWLRSISRAKGTKAKIRNTMSVLFNHAIRWNFVRNNPITGPVRGSGVRQSAKREHIPDVLDVGEFQALLGELQLRERVMLRLGMTTGLRRGELAGLRRCDVKFEKLTIDVLRSVVDQRVGKVKTEASKKPVPIDPHVAEDLLDWYRISKYATPEDYVFATDAARAGSKRGKQPLWLAKVMQYHIQPSCPKGRDRKANRVAYLPAQLYDVAARQRRRRKSCAGSLATRLSEDHDGRLCSGRHQGKAHGSKQGCGLFSHAGGGSYGKVVSPKCPRFGIGE